MWVFITKYYGKNNSCFAAKLQPSLCAMGLLSSNYCANEVIMGGSAAGRLKWEIQVGAHSRCLF